MVSSQSQCLKLQEDSSKIVFFALNKNQLKSKILIISCMPIWVIFQNSVTYTAKMQTGTSIIQQAVINYNFKITSEMFQY